MKMTQTMKLAEQWLAERGGLGVIDNYGHVVAGGERSTFLDATWLRLVVAGRLYGENGRIYVRAL